MHLSPCPPNKNLIQYSLAILQHHTLAILYSLINRTRLDTHPLQALHIQMSLQRLLVYNEPECSNSMLDPASPDIHQIRIEPT